MTPEQRVSGELAEVAFFDLAIEHQLTMLPTGEHRALVPVHWSDQANAIAAPYASAALNAVRAALTSDDPDVVRAMAVRVGLLTEERATPTTVDAGDGAACLSEACVWWPEPHGHVRVVRTRWVSPWLEVPNA